VRYAFLSVLVHIIFVLLVMEHDTCTQSHFEKCILWHEGWTFAVEFKVFVVGKMFPGVVKRNVQHQACHTGEQYAK